VNLLDILSEIEETNELHLGRLLILLGAFAGKRRNGSVEGLTKLAKLDFLLRYPAFLERALAAVRAQKEEAGVRDYERHSVESSMVRFRYGPWDFRYRKFLNILIAKGLAEIHIEGKTIRISLTEAGRQAAMRLAESDPFESLATRANVLKTHFDMPGTKLKNFVYETFPEIESLRFGEEITH
jgi:hypothetical protein